MSNKTIAMDFLKPSTKIVFSHASKVCTKFLDHAQALVDEAQERGMDGVYAYYPTIAGQRGSAVFEIDHAALLEYDAKTLAEFIYRATFSVSSWENLMKRTDGKPWLSDTFASIMERVNTIKERAKTEARLGNIVMVKIYQW